MRQGAEAEHVDEAFSMLKVFFFGAGASGIVSGILESFWPIENWNGIGILAIGASGILLALAVDRIPPRWRSLNLGFGFMAFAMAYVTFAQFAFSPGASNFTFLLLLWPVLWGFAFLQRWLAAVLALEAFALMASVLALMDGWPQPGIHWVFLVFVFILTVLIVRRLVQRVEQGRQELAALNRTLESRVEEQVEQMGRLDRLRRFLSPSVVDVVISDGSGDLLQPHRRQIAAIFCDLRGFTAFSANAEPEEVTDVIERFHGVIGELVERYGATVGHFAGDGVLLYFNDPVPCDNPAGEAVRLCLDLVEPMALLTEDWKHSGFDIGYGVGIALGYATLGLIGFDSRRDYTPLGTVVNLASRLSDEAGRSEILLDQRANAMIDGIAATESLGEITLKGFARPVPVYRVVRA
jgi:class 3 adenylate cyclase